LATKSLHEQILEECFSELAKEKSFSESGLIDRLKDILNTSEVKKDEIASLLGEVTDENP